MDKKEEYREFLESGFWKDLSVKKKFSVGNKCEYCRSEDNLNCHHKIYRDSWYETKNEDLIVLCYNCHKSIHNTLDIYGKIPELNKNQYILVRTNKNNLLDVRPKNKLSLKELQNEQSLLKSKLRPHMNKRERKIITNRLCMLKREIKIYPYY